MQLWVFMYLNTVHVSYVYSRKHASNDIAKQYDVFIPPGLEYPGGTGGGLVPQAT